MGLEQDPVYQRRVKEHSKNHMTNMHRVRLIREMDPSEEELWDYFEDNRDAITMREARKVQMVVLKTQEEAEDAISDSIRIDTFVSEIDPLEFALLDSGHFVLFRKVWKQGKRYIQGMLIEQNLFLKILIERAFHDTALSDMSKLIVAHQGNVFTAFGSTVSRDYLSSAKELQGEVLYQTHLSDPFGDLELIFSVTRLPAGPGAALIAWLALILSAVLFGGFFLMYRLASKQIELAHQQQYLFSAVSH